MVSLPELLFRAPTKNRALSPQSWEGAGGPWMKGRAGTMVNHRVKHAARGRGQAARHHRERKGLPAQRHCFSSNGKLPKQRGPVHISTSRAWPTKLQPEQHENTVTVSLLWFHHSVSSSSARQPVTATALKCIKSRI